MAKLKFTYIFFILTLFSCQNKVKDKYTDTFTSGVIQIAVDQNFQPIIQEELDVFKAMNPKAGIIPHFTNEVEAMNLFLKDSVRVVIATRPISDKEMNFFKSKTFYPHSYKLATDGIALIINNHNADSLITVSQIRKILSGEVTNWTEIFPNSKLGKFEVVFDNRVCYLLGEKEMAYFGIIEPFNWAFNTEVHEFDLDSSQNNTFSKTINRFVS